MSMHKNHPDESIPLRRVRRKDLLPGDVFESDGMVVLGVGPDETDAAKVSIRFQYEDIEATYSTPANEKTLVRRQRPA